MSTKIKISPVLSSNETEQFIKLVLEYDVMLYCRHEYLDNHTECKECDRYCTEEVRDWLGGKNIGLWDHNIFRYIKSDVSAKFPEHTFIGYSLGAEWEGCRLDRFTIKNGKELAFDMLYLDKMDWNKNYDPEFDANMESKDNT